MLKLQNQHTKYTLITFAIMETNECTLYIFNSAEKNTAPKHFVLLN
jgi:hypothetical protein